MAEQQIIEDDSSKEYNRARYENTKAKEYTESVRDKTISDLITDFEENIKLYPDNPRMREFILEDMASSVGDIRQAVTEINDAFQKARERKLGRPIPPGYPQEPIEELTHRPKRHFGLRRVARFVNRMLHPGSSTRSR